MNEAPTDAAGLTQAEANARLQLEGPNVVGTTSERGLPVAVLAALREPMFSLLIAASGIYIVLGDIHEALILLFSLFGVLFITIYHGYKTERALAALRDLTSPRALVVRDGRRVRIAGREVVRGDVVVIKEGDRIPADAMLRTASDLRVDEALLTGESVAVTKTPWDGKRQFEVAGGDDQPFVFAGTLVVQGHGIGQVIATGPLSQIGRIGVALSAIRPGRSPLQEESARLVRLIAVVGLALCLGVTVLYGLTRGGWIDGILAGVTLAMAIVPEEFPMVLTVFLALGAWRLSKDRVLTRQVSAIETLGAATTLCVDKTGTITLNQMMLKRLALEHEVIDLDRQTGYVTDAQAHLLATSIRASEVTAFDPMERALVDAGKKFIRPAAEEGPQMTLAREYPLAPELLVHSHGWQLSADRAVVAAKGAPEAIARVCALSVDRWAQIQAQVNAMASAGLRVLAVAQAPADPRQWPAQQTEFAFAYLGLVGLADPVRPTVRAAIDECYRAGIRVIMMTGDYPATAQAIARAVGLKNAERCITGQAFVDLDDDSRARALADVNVFARVSPDLKLRLVRALRAQGEVVAMTGDGVNDAPALKAAHIGIAMGGRGTDVAREAAALVLLDDDFASIVSAVRLGRRIYDNIRDATVYLIAAHIPIAGMSLLPIALGWPVVFYPVHIMFLEFVIDPACSIAFEAEPAQPGLMQRPPRAKDARLLNRSALLAALVQGSALLLMIVLLNAWAVAHNQPEKVTRAMIFIAVVIGNVGLILSNRSADTSLVAMIRVANPTLAGVVLCALIALGLVLYLPALHDIFMLSSPSLLDTGRSIGAALVALTIYECYKLRVRANDGKQRRCA